MDTLRGFYDAHDGEGFSLPDAYAPDPGPDRDDDVDVANDHDDGPPPVIGTDERRMQVRAYNFWAGLLEDRNFPSIEDLDPTLLPDFGPYSVLLDFSVGLEDPSIAYIGDALAAECETDGRVPKKLSEVPPRSLLSRITDHYMQILANQSPIGFEAEFVNAASATILYRGILLPFSSDDASIDFIYGVINWKEMADARSANALLLEIDQALDDVLELGERDMERADMTDWADGPANAIDLDTPVDARPSFDLSGQRAVVEEPAAPDGLADWLALARESADEARRSEDRTRAALYAAVGRAWDFAIAASEAPDDFAEMLEDAGIAVQERAPMTPVAKLVFGADYDKTRLAEYAAVLAWADRHGVAQGELADMLVGREGGLKAVVAEERAHRRGGEAPAQPSSGPRQATAKKLRQLAPTAFDALPAQGEEFALVMVRRTAAGDIEVLGEVPGDGNLIEKAAKSLLA